MKARALGALLALVLAASAHAQPTALGPVNLAAPFTLGSLPAPSGCVATSVPVFLGSPLAMGCDAGLTYSTATLAAPVHSGTSFVAAAPATITITGATNATPIVVTAVAHGLKTGDRVSISGITGNTDANGYFRVTRLTADTFSLQNYSTGADIAGNGAYGGSPVATAGIVQAGRVLVRNGSAAQPAFAQADVPGSGMYFTGGGTPLISVAGSAVYTFALNGFSMNHGGSSTLGSPAAATLQLGAAATNADGVDQRLQTQGGITGTDRAAGDLDLTTGLGTGAGYSKVTISAPTRAVTGTTAQSRAVVATFDDTGVTVAGPVRSKLAATAVTSSLVLTAADSGKLITTVGSTGNVTISLPAAAAGLYFMFVHSDMVGDLLFNLQAGDTATMSGVGTTTSGGQIQCVSDALITMVAVDSDRWFLTYGAGCNFL